MTDLDDSGFSDDELLALIGVADEKALELLYGRYGRLVFAFVRKRVADLGTAEEIAADVWLGCWKSAPSFRGDSRVSTWLLSIAKRQVWARARRTVHHSTSLDEMRMDIAATAPDPSEVVASNAHTSALTKALHDLPDEVSEVVKLAWLYEMPYAEIGSVLGIPVGTVKSRVSRARKLLYIVLGRQNARPLER